LSVAEVHADLHICSSMGLFLVCLSIRYHMIWTIPWGRGLSFPWCVCLTAMRRADSVGNEDTN